MSTTTAYSYVRFSSAQQAAGDSLRRQTEAAADWCKRHKVTLDKSTTLHDLGTSAFAGAHRTNPDRHALAGFLKLVERGKVARGSYLIIENLDRLSREHIQPAIMLVLGLLQAGVRVVQLRPVEMTFDDKSDMSAVMLMLVELSRGHSESAMKSERVGAAWANKRSRARANGETLTHMLPAWVEERGGKLHAIPARAAAVRRIYELAIAGYGITNIGRRLEEENVRPFGNRGWVRSYIGNILRDRRAMGEFQPRRRNGTTEGEAIAGYFPAVVTENDWLAARAAAAKRGAMPGRTSVNVNVFAGLLKHARDGDGYFLNTKPSAHQKALLVNRLAAEGKARQYGFSFEIFERNVLGQLAEIDPREILDDHKANDEVTALTAELARVDAKAAEIEAELLHGNVAALAKVLRTLEGERRELSAKLAAARQEASSPLTEAWEEGQTIMSTIYKAADPRDARLRLRSLLRRMVSEIRLLVVSRGKVRLAAAQVWFADGQRCRDYLIVSVPAKSNGVTSTEARDLVRSLPSTKKKLDLRDPEHAQAMETLLEALDLDRLL